MVSILRTKNPDFGSGSFPPWIALGDVEVTDEAACSGPFSALFAGEGTGVITQTNNAFPNRAFRLLFRAGASGGEAESPIVASVEFLSSQSGGVLGRVQFTVPADTLPDVTGATPAPCAEFDLSIGLSPPQTGAVRLSFSKPVSAGADILLDAIYLIESTI